jgi:hypothetical protein
MPLIRRPSSFTRICDCTLTGNRYCVPPRYMGRKLTVKADSSSATIYDQHHESEVRPLLAGGQPFSAERFQKESLAQRAAADRSAAQQSLVVLLGPVAEDYLRRLAETDPSLARQALELLLLVREYAPEAVAGALERAHVARACGADYISNILRQQQSRHEVQPPLRLKDPELNHLATDPLSLAEYDPFILRSRKNSRDATSHETEPTQLDDDEPPTGSDDF